MLTLPAPVLNYLLNRTTVNRSPAYLFASRDGRLQDWGGPLNKYGIVNLQKEAAVSSQVFFLEGLLPLNDAELFLPALKTIDGMCADVHLFSDSDGDWVLLLDASLDEFQHSLLQQYRNDLSLLQARQSQRLKQLLGNAAAEPLRLPRLPAGERQDLTILFAALQDVLPYSEQHSPEAVFSLLNLYFRSMIQAIVREGGIVDQLPGNEIMAYFGLLSVPGSPAAQSIQAALQLLEAVQSINQLRQAEQQPTFAVGVGIASGPIALGVLENRQPIGLGAIGRSVQRAAWLQQQADPGEVLIDANTFDQAKQMQQQFSPVDRPGAGRVTGLTESSPIYSFVK